MSGSIFGAATSADIFVAPVCELFLPGPIIPTLSLVLFPSGLLQIQGQMGGGGGGGMSSQTKPLIEGECWEEKPEKETGEKTISESADTFCLLLNWHDADFTK